MLLKILLTFLILLHFSIVYSQNWKPLYENEIYNFSKTSAPDSSITNYIWIDSTRENTQFINRILLKCEKCSGTKPGSPFTSCYKINQCQFLQKEVRDLGGGVYQFYNPGNFIVHFNAKLNETWLFDSLKMTEAQVIKTDTRDIWGVADSFKVVQLTTGDSILFSKSYGMISFPDFTKPMGNYFFLVGLDKSRKGRIMPRKKECFNFHKGDVFNYNKTLINGRWPSNQLYIKDSISDVLGDVSYKIKRSTRFTYTSFNSVSPPDYKFENITVDYDTISVPLIDQYPFVIKKSSQTPVTEYYDEIFKQNIRVKNTLFTYIMNDTLYNSQMNATDYAWMVGANLGFKTSSVQGSTWNAYGESTELMGAVIDGDTLGTLTWNDVFKQDLVAADTITRWLDGNWVSKTDPTYKMLFSRKGYTYHCAFIKNGAVTEEFDYFAMHQNGDITYSYIASWQLTKIDGTRFAYVSLLDSNKLFSDWNSGEYVRMPNSDETLGNESDLSFIAYCVGDGKLIIEDKKNASTGIEVEIYNLNGDLVQSNSLSEKPYIFDVFTFTRGIYLIRISDNKSRITIQKVYITNNF